MNRTKATALAALVITMLATLIGCGPGTTANKLDAPDATVEPTAQAAQADNTCPPCPAGSPPGMVCACGVASPGNLTQCGGQMVPMPPVWTFTMTMPANHDNLGNSWILPISATGGCSGNYVCFDQQNQISQGTNGWSNPQPDPNTGVWGWGMGAGNSSYTATIWCGPDLIFGGGTPTYQTAYSPSGYGPVQGSPLSSATTHFAAVVGHSGVFDTASGSGVGIVVINGNFVPYAYSADFQHPAAWVNAVSIPYSGPVSPVVTSSTIQALLLSSNAHFCGFRTLNTNNEQIFWEPPQAWLVGVPNGGSDSAWCAHY